MPSCDTAMVEVVAGLRYYPGYLDAPAQAALRDEVAEAVAAAPFYRPSMPGSGKPFSVEMTNLGSLGWISDRDGYRYQPVHPATGKPWPSIPASVLAIWRAVAAWRDDPQACLVNFYRAGAHMGLHQDRDEVDLTAPVVSVSLGDAALFRIGGRQRRDPTRSFRLNSGDVLVMGGAARLNFHGIDRVMAGTSGLLRQGGRLNLTLRRVALPEL